MIVQGDVSKMNLNNPSTSEPTRDDPSSSQPIVKCSNEYDERISVDDVQPVEYEMLVTKSLSPDGCRTSLLLKTKKKNSSSKNNKKKTEEDNDVVVPNAAEQTAAVSASAAVTDENAGQPEKKKWNLRPKKSGKPNGQNDATHIPLNVNSVTRPKRKPITNFSIALSVREIESDIMKMTGKKPRRMPRQKRPQLVKKKLDRVFPGLGLEDITPEIYEPRRGKR